MSKLLPRPVEHFHNQDAELRTLSLEITDEMREALTQIGKLPGWGTTKNIAAVLIIDKFIQEAEAEGFIKPVKKRKP